MCPLAIEIIKYLHFLYHYKCGFTPGKLWENHGSCQLESLQFKFTFLLFARETIMRLVSEVGQEKKSAGQSQEAINSLTRERDSLQQKIREMEIEVDRFKHQLAASQDAWGVAKKQLNEKQNK